MSKVQNTAQFSGFLTMTLPEDVAPARLGLTTRPADDSSADLGQLTRAVRAGDTTAFARFYDLYGFRVYKHLLVLARGDENIAREVFQTVAIKLAKKIELFEEERRLLAWLQRVAFNAFIDYCRVRARETHQTPINEITMPAATGTSAETHLRELLQKALAECSPEERELLNAVHIDGQPLREVAAQTGQTYKALESRLGRLRQKLRHQLLNNLHHDERT